MFSMEICVFLWPISQSPERKWRTKYTGASTWEECAHPLAFRMEPCLLDCAVHDHCPIIRTDAQLRRDLFCFVFIFASPLMTTEGITKLAPYACEIPFDSFYCNGRRQRLSEQKKQAWEKVNSEHLFGEQGTSRDLCSCLALATRVGWWQSNRDFLLLEEVCLLPLPGLCRILNVTVITFSPRITRNITRA